MAEIHIERAHTLGLPQARSVARQWADKAEQKFDMACTYEEGEATDLLTFTRSGVSGTLNVTADNFSLDAKLGFLLGAFKERIEGEIGKNLDELAASGPAPATTSATRSA